MLSASRYSKWLYLAALSLLLLDAPTAAQADPVTVTSTVTNRGSQYLNAYAILDSSSTNPYFTLLSVTLSVPANGNAVQNLTAPSGFFADFNPVLGLVDFVEDNRQFTPGVRVDGFSFNSPFNLGSVSFSALFLDSRQNPQTFVGTTSPVPEPATLMLFAAAFVLFASQFRRLQRHSTDR